MLLTRLVELARTDPSIPAPFYADKIVRWVVELNPDGSLASLHPIDLADSSEPSRRIGSRHAVPSVQRSGLGSKPMLAVDTAEYALGWTANPARQGKAAAYHRAFQELVARWHAAEATPPAATLHAFFTDGHASKLIRPEGLAGSQLVAFRAAGSFLHATPSAQRFWADEAQGRKASSRTGLCLVCGQPGPLLQTIPHPLPARLVPGATQAAALVSFNEPTHGFDLRTQLVHTPICTACGLQAMIALERLLAGAATSSTLPGQDARLAWWTTTQVDFSLKTLEDPDPRQVAELLQSAVHGRKPGDTDLAVFCGLMVGGNIARVVVREWIELPLDRVKANLGQWFRDHAMVDPWTGEPRYVGISRLSIVAGRWIPGRGTQQGHYARLGASGADRPDGLYRALLATALLARPLPPKLLAHLVYRIRTDRRVDTDRAALLRLALLRRPGTTHTPEALMPTLNPNQRQPAYLAGRIFAALDDLQQSAVRARGDKELNTTFADRYFARAVTSPAVALVAGRRDARAWLKRLRRDRPAWATNAERRLDELFAQLAEAGGMPNGAVLADQAAFILGYHQQRVAIRAERTSSNTAPEAPTSPEREGASA
jgi:CRISPR-associated protein Csd1